jgi:hypothetical protein
MMTYPDSYRDKLTIRKEQPIGLFLNVKLGRLSFLNRSTRKLPCLLRNPAFPIPQRLMGCERCVWQPSSFITRT